MTATIQTASGGYVNLVDPLPHRINIGDIAHALSNICRFGGHTREFYSVAQHSVLASRIVPPEHAMAALLHDATEAYVGDMVLPLKTLLPDYRAIEAIVWRGIAVAFELPHDLPDCVKQADLVMLATERRDLMAEQSTPWLILENVPTLPDEIDPWTPSHARAEFVMRYWELKAPAMQQGGAA